MKREQVKKQILKSLRRGAKAAPKATTTKRQRTVTLYS
jgi:hypothetical protein